MAELLIKRNDTNTGSTDFILGRGDIIDIRPDGFFEGKNHLTVLVVADLNYKRLLKLTEECVRFDDTEIVLSPDEFAAAKDLVDTIEINDKSFTVYMGRFINPVLTGTDKKGNRTFTAKTPIFFQKTRIKIPSNIMDTLFPNNVYRRTIKKTQFLNNIDEFIDKGHENKKLKNTNWNVSDWKTGIRDGNGIRMFLQQNRRRL